MLYVVLIAWAVLVLINIFITWLVRVTKRMGERAWVRKKVREMRDRELQVHSWYVNTVVKLDPYTIRDLLHDVGSYKWWWTPLAGWNAAVALKDVDLSWVDLRKLNPLDIKIG